MLIPIIFLALGVGAIVGILVLNARRRAGRGTPVPPAYQDLLEQHVGFYRALDTGEKTRFALAVADFFRYIRVHGIKIELDPLDRVLVAASAVIPVFGFREWAYDNLTDVLLYEGAFDAQHFAGPDNRHNVLGMVGSGAMERVMILSRSALRSGFDQFRSPANTGVHEFVHLVDKSDGAVDGIPESLLGHSAETWVQLVHSYLGAVRSGHTDINTYAGTNEAEFLAVVSEYFFKRPDLMEVRHPDLYAMLVHIFQQRPRLDPRVGAADAEGAAGAAESHGAGAAEPEI